MLYITIKIRTLLLVNDILSKCKIKDAEKKNIFREQIEQVKLQIGDFGKKIAQMKENVEDMKQDLFGVKHKMLKELQDRRKKYGEKSIKSDKEKLILKKHKYDPAKLVTDEGIGEKAKQDFLKRRKDGHGKEKK